MKPTFIEKQKTLFKRIKDLRKDPTPSELAFKKRLEDLGIKFIFQKAFIADDYYAIVDFYFPKPHKIVIEVDGLYHITKYQRARDYYRDKYLTEVRGLKVIRIQNEHVDNYDLSLLKPF